MTTTDLETWSWFVMPLIRNGMLVSIETREMTSSMTTNGRYTLFLGNLGNFRLLVREREDWPLVDIYTMWFNSIVPPLHGFCVCMDVSITSNLKFTVEVVSFDGANMLQVY
jgi:hypothetical protein